MSESTPAAPMRISHHATFRAPLRQVWAMQQSEELTRRLQPDVTLCGDLPGTPFGVGRISYEVSGEPGRSRVTLQEVTEYEHERRMVVRPLTPQRVSMIAEIEVESAEADRVGLVFTIQLVPPVRATDRELAQLFEGVRTGLERGAVALGDLLRESAAG